jgi:hypothetical protein
MTFWETKKGVGTQPASYIVILDNHDEDKIVSNIMIQFSKTNPCTIEVEMKITKGRGFDRLQAENREEKKISLTSKSSISALTTKKQLFKNLSNDVVATMISTYLPTNWFIELP